MGRVMHFSLCQAPAGIGYDSIGTIIMSLIEYSPQLRSTSVSMQFKGPRKISKGKNRCHGAQALQPIKHLLAPVIPSNHGLCPTHVLTRCQLMQGMGHLCEFGDKSTTISHEPMETTDFSNSGGGGPIFDGIYPSLISHYSLGRDNVPQICNLPAE